MSGQLLIAKSSVHAQHCVMARDRVAADRAEQMASHERHGRTTRLEGDECLRTLRNAVQELLEAFVVEVVHE